MGKDDALDSKMIVAFDEKYYTQIWPFIRETGGWAVIQDITGQAKYAHYFVYPVWNDSGPSETRFKVEYMGSIKIRGVSVYNVYRQNIPL